MKKVLSIIMVLAMLMMSVSVTVFAEDAVLGSYDNPYQLTAGAMTPLAITVPAEDGAYVFVDDANGSTVTVGHSTSAEYEVNYCRQPITPENDGTLEFTMVSDVEFFYVINPTAEDIVIRVILTAGTGETGTGTMDNPEEVTLEVNPYGGALGAFVNTALAQGSEGHYYKVIAPADGMMSVSVYAYDDEWNDLGWMLYVNNIDKGVYGDLHFSDDPEFFSEDVTVSEGDELQIFANTYDPNNMWTPPAGNIGLSISFSGIGSYMCPEDTDLGDHATTLEADNMGYYYQWTATEAGTATVTINTADGWQYFVNGEMADGSYIYGETHWSDDDPCVPSEDIAVNPGDKLIISIGTYEPDSWAVPAGTIDWTLSFVAGEGNVGGGDDIGGGGDDIGGGEQIDVNFIHNGEALHLGTDTYATSNMYPYTLFDFIPENTGKYTFTSDNALLALVSSNGMWVTVGDSTEYISDGVVTGNSFEWTCTGVGQSIWVAVCPDANAADITVEYEDVEIKEIPREYYENTTAPEAFVFGGDAGSLNYVDTFDGVEDTAVLGADGFYHLNAADGPILFANLNDTLMSLATANSYGQLKQLIYEGDEVVKIIDYTVAMIDYLACMDENTGLYPLTADLVEVFNKAGTSLGWYGAEGWIGGEEADCWMFACYYSEDIRGEGDIPTGGNGNDGTEGGNDGSINNGTEGGANAPSTGDNVMVIVTVAVIALTAMAALLVIRRRRTN